MMFKEMNMTVAKKTKREGERDRTKRRYFFGGGASIICPLSILAGGRGS